MGMHVVQADGTTGVVWLKWNVQRKQAMYNLTVDTAHTFFVGEGQWLVHNACGTQQHHLIPNKYSTHEIVDLAKQGGWKHGSTQNLMELPTTIHNGYSNPHRVYSKNVGTTLDDLWDTATRELWSPSQANQALVTLSDQLRNVITETGELVATMY